MRCSSLDALTGVRLYSGCQRICFLDAQNRLLSKFLISFCLPNRFRDMKERSSTALLDHGPLILQICIYAEEVQASDAEMSIWQWAMM
jgi:hypothetical protein